MIVMRENLNVRQTQVDPGDLSAETQLTMMVEMGRTLFSGYSWGGFVRGLDEAGGKGAAICGSGDPHDSRSPTPTTKTCRWGPRSGDRRYKGTGIREQGAGNEGLRDREANRRFNRRIWESRARRGWQVGWSSWGRRDRGALFSDKGRSWRGDGPHLNIWRLLADEGRHYASNSAELDFDLIIDRFASRADERVVVFAEFGDEELDYERFGCGDD